MLHRSFRPLIALFALAAIVAPSVRAADDVLFEAQSDFNGRVTVRQDEDGVRRLVFSDGATQSSLDTKDPDRLVLPYARAIMVPLAIVPEPKRILIIGLGGGTMPRYLHKRLPNVLIDVVDIDPVVVDVSQKFFQVKPDERLKLHTGDGRKFIETTKDRYDIIFLDAYGADDIPYSLATREFMGAVRSRLAEGGIVVGNVWSEESNNLYWSMVRTYQDTFEELHILRAPDFSFNRIFIALPRKTGLDRDKLAEQAKKVQDKLTPGLDLAAIVKEGYAQDIIPPRRARVLHDK